MKCPHCGNTFEPEKAKYTAEEITALVKANLPGWAMEDSTLQKAILEHWIDFKLERVLHPCRSRCKTTPALTERAIRQWFKELELSVIFGRKYTNSERLYMIEEATAKEWLSTQPLRLPLPVQSHDQRDSRDI